MTSDLPIRRQVCANCLRPQNACICRWARPVQHPVQVLILQHPLEVDNPKGSARLLHLSLPGSRLVTGESFADLPALLNGPFPGSRLTAAPSRPVLLYPETPQGMQQKMPQGRRAANALLEPERLHDAARLRLVVVDATWRKSLRMLHCNPLLQQLPRLALKDMPASRYLVRKAYRADQLSTLEATCAALGQLHGGASRFAPLLAAFDGFVAQQIGYRQWAGSAADSPQHL